MTPNRIVVRPPNWLGDAVLALPAMAAIRAHFSSAHLDIAATPAIGALLREHTDVHPDHVVELSGSDRAIIATLKGGGYDLGILFPNSFRSAYQFWRAGIRERWGFATSGRGLLLTRTSRRPNRRDAPHQMDYYVELVRGLEIPCVNPQPHLAPTGPSEARADALLAQLRVPRDGPLIGLAPGAAYGQAKQWPPDRVASLIARLVRERRAVCLILGATHDQPAARAIESALRANAPDALARTVNVVGRTSLGALTGVTARCDVLISNDSGAMHVAAALGRHVVAIFGPTNEVATRPIGMHDVMTADVFCRPCMLRDCPIDHRCMKRITVDRVFDAVVAHLERAHVQ